MSIHNNVTLELQTVPSAFTAGGLKDLKLRWENGASCNVAVKGASEEDVQKLIGVRVNVKGVHTLKGTFEVESLGDIEVAVESYISA
jgi:hypothetical protein